MRVIAFILSFFICAISYAQFPNTTNTGNIQTKSNFLGALSGNKGIIAGNFDDTTAANSVSYMSGTPGIIISTGSNKVWIRNATATKWNLLNFPCSGLINGGVVTWSGAGLAFNVTAANYCINQNTYNSLSGSITLLMADPSFPRIDVIGVNTDGNIFQITGTPSANPATPQTNPSTQLYLTSVYVAAGATIPSGVTQTTIFDENLGTPTEYNASASGVTVNFNNTVTPYHLVKAASAGSFASGNYLYFTGATYSLSPYNALKFFIKLKISWLVPGSDISVELMRAGNPITSPYLVTDLIKDNVSSYQNISIPLSAFNYTGIADPTLGYSIDGLRFTLSGNNSQGFYLDYITLNGGTPSGNSPYITDIFRKIGTDSVFAVKNGLPYFAYIDSTGGGVTPNLQQVTDVGSITTNNISVLGTGKTIAVNGGDPYAAITTDVNGGAVYVTGALGQSAILYNHNLDVDSAVRVNFPNRDGIFTMPVTVNGASADSKGNISVDAVSSVSGESVDNTDPVNPVVKAVPLSGTITPVTGTIEQTIDADNYQTFKSPNVGNDILGSISNNGEEIGFNTGHVSEGYNTQYKGNGATTTNTAFIIETTGDSPRGAEGGDYYGDNYIDNSYAQVKWVREKLDSIGGSPSDSDFVSRFYNRPTSGTAIDLFIIAGQSNAVGRGDSALSPNLPSSIAVKWDSLTRSFVALKDPLVGPFDSSITGSAWPQFATTYYQKTGRVSGYIMAAKGGTPISDWVSGTPDQITAVNFVNRAIDSARRHYDTVNVLGVLWDQGESDALAGTTGAAYKTALLSVINSWRSGVSKPNLKLFVFQLGVDSTTGDTPAWLTIRNAQKQFCDSNIYSYSVFDSAKYFKAMHLMSDAYHYTQAGYNLMGNNGGYNVSKYASLYTTYKDLGLFTGGGGGGTPGGSSDNIQYNNAGTFGGASNLHYNSSTNKVGIGTKTPLAQFDVFKSTASSPLLSFPRFDDSTTKAGWFEVDADDDVVFKMQNARLLFNTNGLSYLNTLALNQTGKVGVQTNKDALTHQLTLAGGSSLGMAMRNSGSTTDRLMIFVGSGGSYAADENYWWNQNTNFHMLFGISGGTERFTILNGGNVGINNTSPAEKLDVGGNIKGQGILLNRTVQTGNYTTLLTDYLISVNNGVSNVTITLPAASLSTGHTFVIKRLDNTSLGTVTVTATSGNVQDITSGAFGATVLISNWGASGQCQYFYSNGTNYEVLN